MAVAVPMKSKSSQFLIQFLQVKPEENRPHQVETYTQLEKSDQNTGDFT